MEQFITSEVSTLEVHSLDVKTRRRLTNYRSRKIGGGARGKITSFSRQSRTRLLFRARNTPGLQAMVTLTVPDEQYADSATGGNYMKDGLVIKEHCRRLRQWLTYRGIYGLWFLEFQERGAPHIHILISSELDSVTLGKLHNYWYKLVGSSCPHHKVRGVDYSILKKREAAGNYAAKYSAKNDQKTVPVQYLNVGRFWGSFGTPPENSAEYHASDDEILKLTRIARRWLKSEARSKGFKFTRKRSGFVGESFWCAAPVLWEYLKRSYIFPENLSKISLISPHSQTLPFSHPASDSTAAKGGRLSQSSPIRIRRFRYPELIARGFSTGVP